MQLLPNQQTQPLWRVAIIVAALATAIVVFIGPFFAMLQQFGVPITDAQVDSVVAFIQALTAIGSPLSVALQSHEKVTPWDPETGAKSPVGDLPIVGPEGEG